MFNGATMHPLLGRPASSFSREELDALPQLTAFGRPDLFPADEAERLAYTKVGRVWTSIVGAVDSATLRWIDRLVCIAVGEPDLDTLLPRPTRPLAEIAADAARPHRMSVDACEEVYQLVHRLRRVCAEQRIDLSIVIGREFADISLVGADPDLIDAVRIGARLEHHDAAGTRMSWLAHDSPPAPILTGHPTAGPGVS